MSTAEQVLVLPPVRRVLEVCAEARRSGGHVSEYDEITRFVRVMRYPGTTPGISSPASLSALFESVLHSLEKGQMRVSSEFSELMQDAAGSAEDILGDFAVIVEMVRISCLNVPPEYDELPMSESEVRLMFANLFEIDGVQLAATPGEAMESFTDTISRIHPNCRFRLSYVAADLRSALMLFPSDGKFSEAFRVVFPQFSTWVMGAMINAIDEHVREAH